MQLEAGPKQWSSAEGLDHVVELAISLGQNWSPA